MSLRWWLAAVVGALALGAVAAGCGGGGDQTATVPKAIFIKKANAICSARGKDIAASATKLYTREPKSKAEGVAIEAEFVSASVIPAIEKEIEEVDAIGAPDKGEDSVEAIVDSVEEELDQAKADPAKYATSRYAFAQAEKMADKYGLRTCPMGL